MYTRSWQKGHIVKIGSVESYDVPIPDMPPERTMANYDLATKKQYFVYEQLPDSIGHWDRQEQKRFVDEQLHKRKHGEWQLINGQPIYITGKFWYAINYWTPQVGKKMEFRIPQLQVMQHWDMCVRDELCLGQFLIKPRRFGGTELYLAEGYEHVSRVRDHHFGMQNLSGKDAEKDYTRIIRGHAYMKPWFRPINQGSTHPKQGLILSMPSRAITHNSIMRAQDYGMYGKQSTTVKTLDSRITYEATEVGKYDGDILHRYRMGEMGKLQDKKMNPLAQLAIIARCLEKDSGTGILGKMVVETTVEDNKDKSGSPTSLSSLQMSQELWNDSDPNRRNKNGRTASGLYRLYINAIDGAKVDEYGFPQKEFTRKFIQNERESKKREALSSFKRQYPIDLTDVFTPNSSITAFNGDILSTRIRQNSEGLDWKDSAFTDTGELYTNPCVRGNLIWEKQDQKVRWLPNAEGKWIIEQHPQKPCAYKMKGGFKSPANVLDYAIGTDPIDQGEEVESYYKSDAAIAVKRRQDLMLDDPDEEDFNKMTTNRFICSYLHRPDNPTTYYDDLVKTCFYFGAKVFGETNKGKNCMNYFREKGWNNYLAYSTPETAGSKAPTQWQHAVTSLIDQYIEQLEIYIEDYGMSINNELMLQDLLVFNKKNRGRHDLTVAMGFAELADGKLYVQRDSAKVTEIDLQMFKM